MAAIEDGRFFYAFRNALNPVGESRRIVYNSLLVDTWRTIMLKRLTIILVFFSVLFLLSGAAYWYMTTK